MSAETVSEAWTSLADAIEALALKEISLCKTTEELDGVRRAWLGKNGVFNQAFRVIYGR